MTEYQTPTQVADAPLCKYCQQRRTQWDYSTKAFRDYCSRRCGGKAATAAGLPAAQRQRAQHTRREIVRAVVGPTWRDGDPVSWAQLIQIQTRAEALAYGRAYHRLQRAAGGVR
jgi:hypothetical protein